MKDLLPIGRFSQVSRLTVKALRHYDELGLLHPAMVDPDSGYRYYSLAQACDAEQIRLLRQIDMPLEEISEIIGERDPDVFKVRLDRHRQGIEQKVSEYQRVLSFLQRLINNEEVTVSYKVNVKQISDQQIASVRTHTSLPKIGEAMEQGFGDLFGRLGWADAYPVGPPFSIYHGDEFDETDIDVEMCAPVGQVVPGSQQPAFRELPGGTVAYTLHSGAYEEIGPAYQSLASWIQEHGHETAGPPREVYLVGPDRVSDPVEYRTEVIWPIM